MNAAGFTWAGAAEFSSLSEATLRRWARKGVLEISRVGGRVIVLRDSLEALMRGDAQAPSSPAQAKPTRGLMTSSGAVPNNAVLLRGRKG